MPPPEQLLSIDLRFRSSLERLWAAWTSPALILKWFGSDPNGKGLRADLDLSPGGRFEISFQDADLTEHTCTGIYKVVLPLQKLSFTWEWKSEPGVVSFIEVIFIREGNFSRMHFEHKDFGTASIHAYESGWHATFAKLKHLIEQNNSLIAWGHP